MAATTDTMNAGRNTRQNMRLNDIGDSSRPRPGRGIDHAVARLRQHAYLLCSSAALNRSYRKGQKGRRYLQGLP